MEFKFSAGQPDGNQPPFDNYKVCTFKQGKSGQLADEECKFIGDLRTYIKLHGETVHIVGKADLKYIDFTNGGKVCVYGDLVNPTDTKVTGNKHNSSIYAYDVSSDIPVVDGELNDNAEDATAKSAPSEKGNHKDKGIKIYEGTQTTNSSCLGKDVDFGDSWQIDNETVEYN
jgi:hypothetical protein